MSSWLAETARRLKIEAGPGAASVAPRTPAPFPRGSSPCTGGVSAVTGPGYPATPLLRRLTVAHGWHHQLARDAQGVPVAVVAVRVGSTWTDSVAIAGENKTLAMRHRTNERRPVDPAD
jgi:hypothetical protein